jgi:Domain of unknown function (DUF1707)
VIAGPGDEKAAALGGCGHLRASHADRERVIDVLKTALVQGQLTRGEFGERIGQAHASRTYADLAAVTAGIPVGLAGAQPPLRPPRRQLSNAARWGIAGLFTPVVLAAAAAFGWLGGDGRSEPVAFVIAFAYFVFWLSNGADMLWQWHCASVPSAGICVRCAHTAASHRARASCAARPGSLTLWSRCPCAGYVPPGVSPQTADLSNMAVIR